MIEIDGSYGEGGGQILRTSVALAAVTKKSVKIYNIRINRKKPGLKAQHLKGIEAVAKLCDGRLKGASIGSKKIEFYPGKIKGGRLSINVGTAGSIGLVLQSLVVPSLHAEEEISLDITGGTDVSWSPSINYFQHIFSEFLKMMGVDVSTKILRYGFYPKGGGKVNVNIRPVGKLKPLNLTKRGKFLGVDIWSIASRELKERKVAERQMKSAQEFLGTDFEEKSILYVDSDSVGTSLLLRADYENCKLGSMSLGERGKTSEKVGEEAARLLKKQMSRNACLDEWMADQILPYMALAGSGSVSVTEVTEHCKTNIWAIEKFLDIKFEVKDNKITVRNL